MKVLWEEKVRITKTLRVQIFAELIFAFLALSAKLSSTKYTNLQNMSYFQLKKNANSFFLLFPEKKSYLSTQTSKISFAKFVKIFPPQK